MYLINMVGRKARHKMDVRKEWKYCQFFFNELTFPVKRLIVSRMKQLSV